MKVVIAPDSFKDSLSALKVAQAIAQGWQAVFPHAETILCPMADGGEGTIEAVLEVCEGQWRGLAADVTNPLCGTNGASHIFGPQKGASPAQVQLLDAALAYFADVTAQLLGFDKRNEAGSGAAGGLGFAAKSYLNADFKAGVKVVAELNQLEHKISNADWVITGEGKFDQQTLSGKTVFGVSQIAKAHNVPVIVIAGTLGEGYQALYEHGVSAAFSLANGPITLEHACEHAAELIYERTVDIARLIQFSQTSLKDKKT
ncbi:glycerate kinase [Acinetobacter baumannii]|uniref:glycerate kinase n=1 Tax=Acinetobacter baumannii TaxID=470 RepID=UPI00132F730B|nr:glycerate kinase [Acinetobacter baumannii]